MRWCNVTIINNIKFPVNKLLFHFNNHLPFKQFLCRSRTEYLQKCTLAKHDQRVITAYRGHTVLAADPSELWPLEHVLIHTEPSDLCPRLRLFAYTFCARKLAVTPNGKLDLNSTSRMPAPIHCPRRLDIASPWW